MLLAEGQGGTPTPTVPELSECVRGGGYNCTLRASVDGGLASVHLSVVAGAQSSCIDVDLLDAGIPSAQGCPKVMVTSSILILASGPGCTAVADVTVDLVRNSTTNVVLTVIASGGQSTRTLLQLIQGWL